MNGKSSRSTWGALALCAVVLTSGCATPAALSGPGGGYGRGAAPQLRDTGSGARGHEAVSEDSGWEPEAPQRLHRRRPERQGTELFWAGPTQPTDDEVDSPATEDSVAVPEDWPDYDASNEELLAPFLASTSPAQFLALQRQVDMPRLLEAVGDWSAVRLSALGPMRTAAAAEVLLRKRAAFLLQATEHYGPPHAEVFALFLLHSAFDDEVRELLRLLARDKRLAQTLGPMSSVRQELARRGLKLEDFSERAEQPKDVLRGLGRAARDALATSEARKGTLYMAMSTRRGQLPPAYQQALDEVERVGMLQHYAPGSVAVGSMDALTFGVPLGFYHLVAGTAHGVGTLAQGHYEQATRELAPAALMVALYSGGKSLRARAGGGAPGSWARAAQLRWQVLRQVEQRLREQLGEAGLEALARSLQARRELGVFVAEGGEGAALAVYAARGDLPKARAWFSQAKPQRAGPTTTRGSAGKSLGGAASLADEAAGLPLEVVEAKLLRAEREAPGPRLPANVALLEQQRPAQGAPPPGVPEGAPRWSEYVAYRERRLSELKQGQAAAGPLRWESYEVLRGWFARGLAFERAMVALLRADAALPRARRRWLRDFEQPRIETHVGVTKEGTAGVRFADVLVIEQRPPAGQLPRVESFSFKSRDLALLGEKPLTAQMVADAREALGYYGETLNIRRPSLEYLGPEVRVQRVRLIYEGGKLMPTQPGVLERAAREARNKAMGVEVLLQ